MSEGPHAVPELTEPPLPPGRFGIKLLAAIDNGIAAVEKVLVVALVAFMLGAVALQVLSRMFGFSMPGAMEASVFAMLAVAVFAGSLTTHYRRHISVDIISRLLPASVRTVVAVLIDAVGAVLLMYLARAGWFFVMINRETEGYNSAALKIPFWWVQLLIPVAFALISLRFWIYFFEDIKRVVTRTWLPMDTHHHGVDIRM